MACPQKRPNLAVTGQHDGIYRTTDAERERKRSQNAYKIGKLSHSDLVFTKLVELLYTYLHTKFELNQFSNYRENLKNVFSTVMAAIPNK